jgi:hypothetical protein
MPSNWLQGVLLAAALLPLGAPSAEAGCVRPDSITYSDSVRGTNVVVGLGTRTVTFTTPDGRQLTATGARVVDDGRFVTVSASSPTLTLNMRADLALGRVRAQATEPRPARVQLPGRIAIRSKLSTRIWTLVAYGGPSQEGTCGRRA